MLIDLTFTKGTYVRMKLKAAEEVGICISISRWRE